MKISTPYFLLMFLVAFICQTSMGQAVNITGTVSDSRTGEALPGVNVIIQGTSIGTATNVQGAYSIMVPTTPAVLQYSAVGYSPEEVRVTSSSSVVDVALIEDVAFLSNIVEIGRASCRERV